MSGLDGLRLVDESVQRCWAVYVAGGAASPQLQCGLDFPIVLVAAFPRLASYK